MKTQMDREPQQQESTHGENKHNTPSTLHFPLSAITSLLRCCNSSPPTTSLTFFLLLLLLLFLLIRLLLSIRESIKLKLSILIHQKGMMSLWIMCWIQHCCI